jgi:uncharacterized protein YbjT (DUF2867 family)
MDADPCLDTEEGAPVILVTGATGTTGSEVACQLAAQGSAVRAFVRDPEKAAPLQALGIDLAVGDLNEPETLSPALEGVERLFLLTSADPRQVEQQGQAVLAAQAAGVRHIVKLSALGADLDASISVARWHAHTEKQIEASGLAWTHLRPHYFMQNLLTFAPTIATEGKLYAPMRDGTIGLVDARDVAAVAVAVLTSDEHAGKVYEITGPESLSFDDLAATIGAATGRQVTYVDIPPSEAEKAMVAAGVPDWMADALVGLYGILSAGHASITTQVVPEVTGQPARTFAAFARENAKLFAPA